MNPAKLQPALLGGLVMGVLSALPVINFANCCCAWMLFGGGLAAYLMQQNHPARVSAGDGAIVGALAGVFGAVVSAVLSIPISMALGPFQARMMQRALENAQDLPPEFRAFIESIQGGAVVGAAWVLGLLFSLCLSAFFGLIGGLFGALLFAKDAPPRPPPPVPPTFNPPTFTPPPLPGGDEGSESGPRA
jgi:hypothetical protein